MISFSINQVNLMRTLTMSLDLVVNGVDMHQLRTAAICQNIAEDLCLPPLEQQGLLSAALMHDIGAAPDLDERQRLASPEQESIMGKDIYTHAEKGFLLLEPSLCFQSAALPIRYHHDSWEGGNPSGLAKDALPLGARIIHVADRIEVLINKSMPVLSQADGIRDRIKGRSGSHFDPDIIDSFIRCSQKESFWLDLANPGYASTFFGKMCWGQSKYSAKEVLSIAELFATLIDRKSLFTATHSRSVAQVAVLLAEHHGFCQNERYMMHIAGLLHDLGKLSIPSSILEKAGKLDQDEINLMRQHTYYTYRILEQIEDMGTIAQWAAFHHETLDGKGYPFKLQGEMLPLGSRIMAVADIFVALAEDRPYRKRMESTAVQNIMRGMVNNNKIDGRIVESLFDLYDRADNIVLSVCRSDVSLNKLAAKVCEC